MIITKNLIKTTDKYNIPILHVLQNINPDGDIESVERLCMSVDQQMKLDKQMEQVWQHDLNAGYYEWISSDEMKADRNKYLKQRRKDLYQEYLDAPEEKREALEDEIKTLKQVEDGVIVTDDQIYQAKQYPISNLLGKDVGGKYKCLWHSDTNPSLHYYPKTNSVHCFSCSASGDAIDVYMMVHGCSFKEAVLTLSN